MCMLYRAVLKRAAMCAALVLTAPGVLSAQALSTEDIACGASSGTQQTCKTNGYATRVELINDLSGRRCQKGSNWGHTDSFIWTNGGCRGDFRVAYRTETGSASTRIIPCGSASTAQQVQCKTNGYATSVRLVRDQSYGQCRQGSNWGFTDSFIWTNKRCRGEFEVTYRAATGGTAPTRVISCGTTGESNVSCNPFGSVASVRLVRELSTRRCRQGVTWGYTDNDLWTKQGCKGDFEVTYRLKPQPR